ncbi:MAG TPA: TrmH family RNA methyltransferase [Solirubrobacterales bacterium]|jgi:TrmH family RNA methyltransferase
MGRAEHERTVRFRSARRDPALTVVEGFHALKHALRFGAEVVEGVAVDPAALEALAAELAPDLAGRFAPLVETIDAATLAELVPLVPRTGVVAIARRPPVDVAAALADPAPAPVVLLEQPRNMGNIGACVRVAAAAGAAALLSTGENDPWFPDAVRGAAGLQFALPVAAIAAEQVAAGAAERPLLAIDPEGEPLAPAELPPRALLAFGTERDGVSAATLERAAARVAIPMRAGVSSLNLATSVAVVLFALRPED